LFIVDLKVEGEKAVDREDAPDEEFVRQRFKTTSENAEATCP